MSKNKEMAIDFSSEITKVIGKYWNMEDVIYSTLVGVMDYHKQQMINKMLWLADKEHEEKEQKEKGAE